MLHAVSFSKITKENQEKIVSFLISFWKDSFKNKTIAQITEYYLHELYASFAFIDDETLDVIGSVGVRIDTPTPTFNTNYWICDLFVFDEHRNQNHGKFILSFIESFLRKKQISIAHLWCEENVVSFYQKFNWNLSLCDNVPDKTTAKVMIKML